jgi:Tfp pilus assembly protein PilZ
MPLAKAIGIYAAYMPIAKAIGIYAAYMPIAKAIGIYARKSFRSLGERTSVTTE